MRGVHAFFGALSFACAVAPGATQEAPDLAARAAALDKLQVEPRLRELRSIADAVLYCDDAEQRRAVAGELRVVAATGAFYSPSATEPSFLWFEFERALRRIEVREGGCEPGALEQTLQVLMERREGALPMLTPLGRGNGKAPAVHDLTSFGWHGSGEVIEGVADLAERAGPAASAVGAELARYLACERPHPLTPHPEGAAGLAEPAPLDDDAKKFPVMWSDGYRIALARAVLATRPPDVDPEHATLHLLYSPRRADRLAAVERLRAAALTDAAVEHLAAQLGDGDRLVVREAMVTLAGGGDAARAGVAALQKVAAGGDRELRAVAERALARLRR